MATRKYNWSKAQEKFDIVEAAGAAIASGDFQFTVDLATVTNTDGINEIILGLEILKQYIQEDTYPPA